MEGVSVVTTGESVSYSDFDKILLLSYASPMEGLFGWSLFDDISFGTTLKLFSKELSGVGISGGAASGYDVDLGFLFRPRPALKFGLVAKNIVPHSMGGKITWVTGVEESLPAKVTSGMSLKIYGENGLRQMRGQELYLNFDADFSDYRVITPTLLHFGIEWIPLKFFSLRFGLDQDAVGEAAGVVSVANKITAWIGLNYSRFRFDYAYHQFQLTPGMNNHFVSLTYKLFRE